MKNFCVFVGGPIQHAIDADGGFHAMTRHRIETAIATLRSRGYRVISAHQYENFGERDVSGRFQDVCSRDFQWMRQCDIFVAVLPLDGNGKVIHSASTSVELGWASAMNKPIVLICDPSPVYSHLVTGLDALARVAKIDINRGDMGSVLCDTVAALLSAAPEAAVSSRLFSE
jgi:nucleoside 2-deoxyribosyltransferase